MLIIFLSNAFVSPSVWFLNISYILAVWRRKKYEKEYGDEQEVLITQRELNAQFENPSMDISFKYSYICKTFLMSVFYMPILPIGTIISIIGITIAYLIEKFNLLHTYKRPEMLDEGMCSFYIQYFKLFLFTYAIGNWLFIGDKFSSNTWGLVSIIIFGSLVIIPYHLLFMCDLMGVNEEDILVDTYDKQYFQFSIDYERQNPLTKNKGLHNYLEKLKEAGIIDDEEYKIISANMAKDYVNVLELYYDKCADMNSKAHAKIAHLFGNNSIKKANKKGKFGEYLVQNKLGIDVNKNNNEKIKSMRTQIFANLINNEYGLGKEIIAQGHIPHNQPGSTDKPKKDLFKKYRKTDNEQINEEERQKIYAANISMNQKADHERGADLSNYRENNIDGGYNYTNHNNEINSNLHRVDNPNAGLIIPNQHGNVVSINAEGGGFQVNNGNNYENQQFENQNNVGFNVQGN